ncbi:hypothetical protein amyaer_3978 [Microcystis aeruginosa NIES-2481]|nr:hypothetical protein [Microcystis aeruginosa]AOC54669.1 hypothetical protein amyaer_3978 [Microcystis aeruginosa NIES-2481]
MVNSREKKKKHEKKEKKQQKSSKLFRCHCAPQILVLRFKLLIKKTNEKLLILYDLRIVQPRTYRLLARKVLEVAKKKTKKEKL